MLSRLPNRGISGERSESAACWVRRGSKDAALDVGNERLPFRDSTGARPSDKGCGQRGRGDRVGALVSLVSLLRLPRRCRRPHAMGGYRLENRAAVETEEMGGSVGVARCLELWPPRTR